MNYHYEFKWREAYFGEKVLLFHGVADNPNENLLVYIINMLNTNMSLPGVSVKKPIFVWPVTVLKLVERSFDQF